MRLPFGWLLVVLAALAAGIAAWAGPNLSLALPAGVAAVVFASLLFGEAWLARGHSVGRVASAPRAPPVEEPLRSDFRSGRLGRESIVVLLDRLEREGPRPDLPARRPEEFARLGRMSGPDFRAYVGERVEALERET